MNNKPKSKMTLARPAVDQQKATEFIKQANKPTQSPKVEGNKPKETYPWEEPHIREDVVKTFNLRLSEPDHLKLQYIVENSNNKSVHGFIMSHLKEAIDAELKKLISNQ